MPFQTVLQKAARMENNIAQPEDIPVFKSKVPPFGFVVSMKLLNLSESQSSQVKRGLRTPAWDDHERQWTQNGLLTLNTK